MKKTARCGWAGNDPLMMAYHDDEWGVPVHDDQKTGLAFRSLNST